MREYIIDCAMMTDRKTVHDHLAQALELPEYYGRNLDALHDCLCELAPCSITLRNPGALSALGEYGEAMQSVFFDVSLNTADFELTIESGAANSAD